MRKKILCAVLLLSAIAFSFKPEGVKRHYFQLKHRSTTITGYTSTIGGDKVLCVFDRDNQDDGNYVHFSVSYDGQGSYTNYELDMGDNLHYAENVQGPPVVGDAFMGSNIYLTQNP